MEYAQCWLLAIPLLIPIVVLLHSCMKAVLLSGGRQGSQSLPTTNSKKYCTWPLLAVCNTTPLGAVFGKSQILLCKIGLTVKGVISLLLPISKGNFRPEIISVGLNHGSNFETAASGCIHIFPLTASFTSSLAHFGFQKSLFLQSFQYSNYSG